MSSWPAPTTAPLIPCDTPTLAPRPIEVGDVFRCSWGYDQTNVDWYRVVGVTAKTIKVQEWSTIVVSDNGPATHVVPGDEPRMDWHWLENGERSEPVSAPIKTKRPRWAGDRWSFRVASYADAYLWTPEHGPAHETGLGWGH